MTVTQGALRDTLSSRPRGRLKVSWRNEVTGYAFIAPNLVGLAVFTFLPLLFTVVVSFSRWNLVSGFSGVQWVGMRNFQTILSDPEFWHSAELTGLLIAATVPATIVCGLAVAVALNGPVPGRSVLRLIFFIPFIANIVAVSETWLILYSPQGGPIDDVLIRLGIHNPPLWLASSAWALPALAIMTIWYQVGYAAILYSAALQDIPQDLLDAAEIDGANAATRFTRITFPLVSPVTFLLVLTGVIFTSQSFGFVNLMTRGGPGTSTTVLSYYVYQNAFQFYHFGYAAAMSVCMLVGVSFVAFGMWFAQRRLVHYD